MLFVIYSMLLIIFYMSYIFQEQQKLFETALCISNFNFCYSLINLAPDLIVPDNR